MASDFFVHTGRWKWFCIFSISGGRSEHTFRSFFFLLQVRETEIDFIFSWSWQVTVKKAGFYGVYLAFAWIKVWFYVFYNRRSFPKSKSMLCVIRYLSRAFTANTRTLQRWSVCPTIMISGDWSVFFLFVGSNFCLGYLKRFMIENRGYENSNCLHHNWGVLFAHMRFLMGKIWKSDELFVGGLSSTACLMHILANNRRPWYLFVLFPPKWSDLTAGKIGEVWGFYSSILLTGCKFNKKFTFLDFDALFCYHKMG